MPRGTRMNGELLWTHDSHGELRTHSANGEQVRARDVSVNHSADACGDLSMARDMCCENMALCGELFVAHEVSSCGELLVAHNPGSESHGKLFMAHDARDITQHEPIGSAEHCHPEKDDTMHGEPPPRKANDLLVTADADNGPCEALLPHGSTRQSSEHVEASAPWLRRQVNDVDPQEHGESTACDTCDALGVCGELWTHMPSDAMQQTPLVFAETCHPARDDGNAADRSPGSGGKKQAWEQSRTTPSRTNILMAGPSTRLLCVDQPLPKGQARAKPMPSLQRAKRPSVLSDNSATSNVTDIHQTLPKTSQQLGEMSHWLTAMDNQLLALE